MYVFDLHCDTLFEIFNSNYKNRNTIEMNLKNGQYIAQCFAIYTPPNIFGTDAQRHYNHCKSIYNDNFSKGNVLKTAINKDEIMNNAMNRKISALLTLENAEFLNNDINKIELIKSDGVRILGLVHNCENCLGYAHSDEANKNNLPLKNFGKEVVYALNSENIYIDVSHLNIGGFKSVIDISSKPVLATHTACRNIHDHSRNLYDWQIKQIANSGGVVGILYYSKFLNGTNKTTIEDIIFHLKHLINIGGEEIAVLGSDFDGFDCILPINNCGEIQTFCDAIICEFGFDLAEKICYKNALRLF